MHFHGGTPPDITWTVPSDPWGQVLIQPSRWAVCDSGMSTAPQVGDLLSRSIEGPVETQIHGGPRTGQLRYKGYRGPSKAKCRQSFMD